MLTMVEMDPNSVRSRNSFLAYAEALAAFLAAGKSYE
jgi:hypothetical protein